MNFFHFIFFLFFNTIPFLLKCTPSSLNNPLISLSNLDIFLILLISLSLLLLLDKLGVESVGVHRKQVLVVALLDDLSLLHHDDVVGVADRRQSVRDHYSRDRAQAQTDLVYRRLHLFLVLFVQGTRGFV